MLQQRALLDHVRRLMRRRVEGGSFWAALASKAEQGNRMVLDEADDVTLPLPMSELRPLESKVLNTAGSFHDGVHPITILGQAPAGTVSTHEAVHARIFSFTTDGDALSARRHRARYPPRVASRP